MVIVRMVLRFSLIKVRHAVHLQWDIMRKGPISWDNVYGGLLL